MPYPTLRTVIRFAWMRRLRPLIKALGALGSLKFLSPALLILMAAAAILTIPASFVTGSDAPAVREPVITESEATAVRESVATRPEAVTVREYAPHSLPATTGSSSQDADAVLSPVPDQVKEDGRIGSIFPLFDFVKNASSSFTFSIEEEYDNTVYKDANANQPGDFITIIKLDMSTRLSGHLLDIRLNYQPEQLLFSHDVDRNELRHEFSAILNTSPEGGIILVRNLAFLDLSDTVTRKDFYSRRETKKEDLSARQASENKLKVHPYIRKNLTRTDSLECGYEYTNTAYSISQATDRESSTGSLIVNRIFSRKLEGKIIYRLKKEFVRSGDFHDYKSQEIGLGLSRRVGTSLSLTGTGGYTWLTLSNDHKDEKTFLSAGLDGALPFMKSQTLSYSYEESFQNSIDSGVFRLRRHSLGGNYHRRIQIAWTLFSQKEHYQERRWIDRSWGADASLTVPLHRRVDLNLAAEWTSSDFEPEEEVVKYRSANTGLLFRLSPCFKCAVGYTYSRNDSNVKANDYRDTTASVRVSMEL
ncbi:MAG: hypothetical protein AB1847_15055 [bacterium]